MITKRIYLVVLLAIVLLFTGCIGGGGPDSRLLTVELGDVGPHAVTREILLSNDAGKAYLVPFDSTFRKSFHLPAGKWVLWGYARNARGQVIAVNPEPGIQVRGDRRQKVHVPLYSTSMPTVTPVARNVKATWKAGGLELTWEHGGEHASGNWEVWARRLHSPLWEKLANTTERHYWIDASFGLDYDYGVRFVARDAGIFTSPLVEALFGELQITWEFEHQFPPVRLQYAASDSFDGGMFSTDDLIDVDSQYEDLLAQFDNAAAYERRYQLLNSVGLEIKEEIPQLLTVLVEPGLNSEGTLEEWSYYKGDGFSLSPNWIVYALGALPPETFLSFLRVPLAQKVTRGSTNITIAVLDTGLDESYYGRRNLVPGYNLVSGYNFVHDNSITQDDHHQLHGTKVAGLIKEVMPEVSLMPIKVLSSSGYGRESDVIKGLLYAEQHGADIINLSLGYSKRPNLVQEQSNSAKLPPLEDVIENMATKGIIMVAASGNSNKEDVYFPAAYPEVFAVGSVVPTAGEPKRFDDEDQGSNYGPELDFMALGGSKENPLETTPGWGSGTSFATPQVTGIVGLMLANGISPAQVGSTLAATAMDLGPSGWDKHTGYGLVNAYWAVSDVRTFKIEIRDRVSGNLVKELNAVLQGEGLLVPLPPGEYEVKARLNLDYQEYYYKSWVNVTGSGGNVHLVLTEIPR